MKGALSWPFLRLYILTLLYFSANSILNVMIPLKMMMILGFIIIIIIFHLLHLVMNLEKSLMILYQVNN